MFSQGATTLPAITINSPIANVHIPAGTIVTSSDSHWDGHLAVPKEAPLTVLTPDWIEIQTVMIGADSTLTFDKAVRIELPDQAGKEAGFIRNGLFVPITTWCAADTQDFADTLLAGGDCKIDTSNELVIWTKHFTTFVTYHPGDTIAPTTTAEIAGTPGTHGWFASNISVTLNAVDNPGGSGVDYTKYSLDNGSWQTYATTSPISIASEGVHTLQFYSTDKAGNQEATSTLAVKIDKTPPEAMIGFSTSTKIIQFTGTDNLTAVTAATTTTSIILSDQAGNTLKLSIAKNVLKPNSATFIMPAFSYSTGTTTNASTSLRYFWSTDRAGKYTLFISAIKTPTQRIVSIYTSLTNKTYIVTSTPSDDADDLSLRSAPLLLRNRLKTFTGLEIPSVSTQRGAVVIDY